MRRSERRRSSRGLFAFIVATAVAGVVTAITLPSSALTGSSFEETDGNLTVDTAGAKDWANVGINCTTTPKVGCAIDKLTGSTDDSFGQGTAENDPVPSVVDGSIPNNKSDLQRFYVAATKENGKDFLHLAWERVQDPSGTTNMDFEFNQSSTLSANGVTPVRTAGDILIKYDLSQGGTKPVLGRHTWVTTGKASDVCEAGNKLPCWSKVVDLSASGLANGAINAANVSDPILPGPNTVSARTFGEASINLTDIGVFPPTQCVSFGSVYLKSRSSDSFTAAIKDFIVPVGVSVTNCGEVKIHKQDDAGTPLSGAVFTLFTDKAPLGGNAPHGSEDTQTTMACTTDSSGNCTISTVPFAQYWVVETTTPAGHKPAADQNIILTAATSPISLTFVNPRQPASVTLHKQDDTGAPLASAVFTLFTDNAPVGGNAPHGAEDKATTFTCTTGSNGNCTMSAIFDPGNYWLVETTTPPGHGTAADQAITLSLGQDLTVATPFVDPRKFTIIVLVCQESDNALHASTVTVDGQSKTSLATSSVPDICTIGGASYPGKDAGSHPANVSIP